MREREREGGGGGEWGHERRAQKRTGWKVHIESKTQTNVSQHTCVFDSMWTFQSVRFRARLS